MTLSAGRRQSEARRVLADAFPFACCGFCGQHELTCPLDIAHLDHNAANNRLENLARLCPTHHRQYDADLLLPQVILLQQDHWQETQGKQNHKARMKNAGILARDTRKANEAARVFAAMTPGQKAAFTRRKNAEAQAASAAATVNGRVR
jgi:hypothetical protein